mmetsp:Transcript_36972/g.98248  ORF Transcript_36972/g.98248 Transcript_36972/m.98248 type:complete len:340 (-) Transcript_36972:2570-3589(-)
MSKDVSAARRSRAQLSPDAPAAFMPIYLMSSRARLVKPCRGDASCSAPSRLNSLTPSSSTTRAVRAANAAKLAPQSSLRRAVSLYEPRRSSLRFGWPASRAERSSAELDGKPLELRSRAVIHEQLTSASPRATTPSPRSMFMLRSRAVRAVELTVPRLSSTSPFKPTPLRSRRARPVSRQAASTASAPRRLRAAYASAVTPSSAPRHTPRYSSSNPSSCKRVSPNALPAPAPTELDLRSSRVSDLCLSRPAQITAIPSSPSLFMLRSTDVRFVSHLPMDTAARAQAPSTPPARISCPPRRRAPYPVQPLTSSKDSRLNTADATASHPFALMWLRLRSRR